MATIRKVSAEVLDSPVRGPNNDRPLTEAQIRRKELDKTLATAINRAASTPGAAFLIELDGEKPATVRNAFLRAREGVSGGEFVNLFSRSGDLYIARRPQTRGSKRSAA